MRTIFIVFTTMLFHLSLQGQVYNWFLGYGDTGSDIAYNVHVDTDGYLYMVGNQTGHLNIDTCSLVASPATDRDMFISKFDTTGTCIWLTGIAAAFTNNGQPQEIVTTDSNVYVMGDWQYNSQTHFLGKFTKDGTEVGYKYITADKVSVLAVDDADFLYVGGNMKWVADFYLDTTLQNVHYQTTGNKVSFLAKYHPDGHLIWAKLLGEGEYFNEVTSVKVEHNTVYVTGIFNYQMITDNDTLSSLGGVGADNVFLIALDTASNYQWGSVVGSRFNEVHKPMLVRRNNALAITATEWEAWVANRILYWEVDNAGTATVFDTLSSFFWLTYVDIQSLMIDDNDVMTVLTGRSQHVTNDRRLEVFGVDNSSLAAMPVSGFTRFTNVDDTYYGTGSFAGSITYGNHTLTTTSPQFDGDIMLMKMTCVPMCFPDFVEETVQQTLCLGDTIRGYFDTGTYLDTLTSIYGYDSIVSLDLTVSEFISTQALIEKDDGTGNGSITLSAINGGTPPYTYQWSTGDTTQSIASIPVGEYIVTVTDIDGCIGIDTFNIFYVSTNNILSNDHNPQFTIYPNPSTMGGLLSLRFDTDISPKAFPLMLSVYDGRGRLVQSESISEVEKNMVVSMPAPSQTGLFVVEVRSNQGHHTRQKIVITN